MSLDITSSLIGQILNHPQLIILATIWLTYSYVMLKGGFVSDDLSGIEQYDGTLLYPVELPNGDVERDAQGQVVKKPKICYGTLSKWVRYHLSGGHFPSRHRYPKSPDGAPGAPIPSGKVASHHHVLSVVVHSVACILTYHALLLVTTPAFALMTILLFIVHPTCLQAVAWPSAIGYVLSLVCISASLLIGHWTMNNLEIYHLLIGLAGLTFFQVWGVYAQAIPMATCVIFAVLGYWPMAIVSGLVSGAVAFVNLGGYVTHRKSEFKKQQMEQSISFNWRKPIVALKTAAYYIYLALWPARLGLYHQWGFHYDKQMERVDWRAISGFFIVLASVVGFIYGDVSVKIGIVWFYAFIFLFLNWITAQQWVTERYLYIPVIGICLLASTFLPFWAYFIIFGMMLSRTLCHIATYDNELRFYLSNTWNFPKSEVAFGNLGVAYASIGLSGAANDSWVIAGSHNSDYDVPFYNLFSKTKTAGVMAIQNGAYDEGLKQLSQSVPMLEKVMSCKVLHFPEMWGKELNELRAIVANPVGYLYGELNRLSSLKYKFETEFKIANDTRKGELSPSINDTTAQIERLVAYLTSKGVHVEINPEKALLQGVFKKGVL